MDGVSKISHDAPRDICGVGFVILSRAQDVDSYIASCFRNNRLSIITDSGEVIGGCIVAKNAWQYIEFPPDIHTRGSQVIWINIPHQNKVVILDILSKRDELNPIQATNKFKFQRAVEKNVVTIQGDGLTGTLTLIAQGSESGEGQVFIKVLNANELAVFNLYIQGALTVDVEADINFRTGTKYQITVRDEDNPDTQAILNYILGTGYALQDEFNNNVTTTKNGIFNEVPSSKKVYSRANGASSEPGLLGNKTTTLFNDIIGMFDNMNTVLKGAAAGEFVLAAPVLAASPIWLLKIQQMRKDIEVIKAQNFELS